MDFDLNSIPELVSGENEPPVHHLLVDDEDKSETYFPINPTDTRMEIPTINLDDTFDYENMYTAGDAGSLQAHNVANDEMQVFEEMSDHADTMHTSVATGATTATANTISSEDSGTDDSEAQSTPSQDIPCAHKCRTSP
ncbi:Os06g0249000 [Oryza sativa Japonica Group]|uniref:Uncharacterized protein n=2 Tax=Oryza sativa subsp. japonica TaxID=39947 RepID=A0A8J8YIQ9_ORYSJ|nr:hypothetical protein OsJ_20820 [Oryza sativa Japonica Group]BAS97047.1 Os06g0249000 [Oryza sativa Japonica Group]